MELFFYNIFLLLFRAGARVATLFNSKAKKWVEGREGIWEKLQREVGNRESGVWNLESGSHPQNRDQAREISNITWMHCASLGEFEQGRPLIEKLKSQYPHLQILLTFFSPSGFEIRKDYKGADWVFYLPLDGPGNARRFLDIVNPSLVIFVKYEFWYYYLREIKNRKIPLLLISALFRENSAFFKWYGGLQRKMLFFFDHLFVQTRSSKSLLDNIGLAGQCSISGDTRFDRVIEIAEKFSPIPVMEKFAVDKYKVIVAGSTWPQDEEILQKTIAAIADPSLKLVIAPHETNKEHVGKLLQLFPGAVLYSQLAAENAIPLSNIQHPAFSILIIDNIGMLSRLYNYATITYIGGGFGKGIHNTLEAAVYGKPVLFGPAYHKFQEAIDLVERGAAISIDNIADCFGAVQKLLQNENAYIKACKESKDYVYTNKGATDQIMRYIQEKRLLTN